MSLIIREAKNNFKSFVYWTVSIVILIWLLIAIYPIAVEKMANLGDIINVMPKEIIVAFGLENYDWDIVLNYLSYEFQYIFLACAIFAAGLGAATFGKEEQNKTIQLIYSKPVTRNNIFLSKVFTVVMILLTFNLILFAITYILLKIIVVNQVIYLDKIFKIYQAMFLIQLIYMSIGVLIATILKRPKSASGISTGIVIFTYLLGMFSKIADELKHLLYISPLHYFIPDKIVREGIFEMKYLILSLCIILISLLLSYRLFSRKDFTL